MQGDDFQDKPDIKKSEYIKMTLVCWILVDKYGLAIYNENRVKAFINLFGLWWISFGYIPDNEIHRLRKKPENKESKSNTADDCDRIATKPEKIDFLMLRLSHCSKRTLILIPSQSPISEQLR